MTKHLVNAADDDWLPLSRYSWSRASKVVRVDRSRSDGFLPWDFGPLRERIEHASAIKRGAAPQDDPGPFELAEFPRVVELLRTSRGHVSQMRPEDRTIPAKDYDPDKARTSYYEKKRASGWRPWDKIKKSEWLRERFPRKKAP